MVFKITFIFSTHLYLNIYIYIYIYVLLYILTNVNVIFKNIFMEVLSLNDDVQGMR